MKPTVALTYDDGPSEWTTPLLDVLAKHDARATFFVLGCHIRGREDLLRRMVDDGHAIGLHGWSHTPNLHPFDMRAELEDTARLVTATCDQHPRLWRAPWNREDFTMIGFDYVGVDVDGFDVSRAEHAIVASVLKGLRDGVVVGLHDGIAPNGEQTMKTRDATVKATARILAHCRSVTVGELRGVSV